MTDAAMGPVTVGLGTPPAIATAASGRTKNGMTWSQMGMRNGFVTVFPPRDVAPNKAPRERTSQGERIPLVAQLCRGRHNRYKTSTRGNYRRVLLISTERLYDAPATAATHRY